VFAASIVESLQRRNPENASSNEYAVDVDAKLATPLPIASPVPVRTASAALIVSRTLAFMTGSMTGFSRASKS